MNVNLLKMGKAWLLVFLFLIVGVTNAQARIHVFDDLTLDGFLRQTAVMSMGTENTNHSGPVPVNPGDPAGMNIAKPRMNLIRSLFQVELNYQPTDIFRFFMKTRVTHDQTYLWQSDLPSYDTTPWTFDHHGSDMRTGYGEDTFIAEIWETWVNFETDLLWVRLGKQQIAWGDLVSVRVADNANPLDRSWHLIQEPEEFENIRIPEWAARVYFTLPETMSGPFYEIFIDAFINPGDLHPDIHPASGSPYTNAFSTVDGDENFNNDYNDLRGETEWGVRLGYNLGVVQGTFSYMSVHMDYPVWHVDAPDSLPNHKLYPEIDIYAMTLNYAFDNPINTSVQFEASYTPNYMWQSTYIERGLAPGGPPLAEEGAWWKAAIILEKDISILPRKKLMTTRFMWYRHWVDSNDADNVKVSPATLFNGNRLDWAWDLLMVQATQIFGPGGNYNHEATAQVFWCPEGSYKFQLWYNWKPTQSWRFDLGAAWNGGSGDRAFLHSNNSWNDELFMRMTYMF